MYRFVIQRNNVDYADMLNRSASASSIPGAVGQQCSICLDNICEENTVIKLDCNHIFHGQCISQWLSENSSCPLCRSAPDQTETLQIPLNHMLHMQSVFLKLHTADFQHITIWHVNNTLVDVLQYVQRLCPSMGSNVCVKIRNHVFKTSESFEYLNQPLAFFAIIGEHDAHISQF